MPDHSFRNGLAAGLIVGFISTTILLLFSEQIYHLVNCITQAACPQYSTPDERQNEPEWWYWTRRLVAAEDTLAQWIMAFFTILAVGLLLFTLFRTAEASKAAADAARAANETNRIMRDERRPWVTLIRDPNCIFEEDGYKYTFGWHYNFQNVGKSPAFKVKMHIKVWKSTSMLGSTQEFRDFVDTVKTTSANVPVLHPNETTEFVRRDMALRSYFDGAWVRDANGIHQKAETPGSHFGVYTCLTYRLGEDEGSSIALDARIFVFQPLTEPKGRLTYAVLEHPLSRIIETKQPNE